MNNKLKATLLIGFFLAIFWGLSGNDGRKKWVVSDCILTPGPEGAFDEVAVKDPSIVFSNGMWHLFYTAASEMEYTTGYVSAKSLDELQDAKRHELRMIRGKSRYGCAPQVFYFEPQRQWYLLFQSRDANYQPAFSTTRNIADPSSWSTPVPLIEKDTDEKWIDFWVICNKERAFLFYTQSHDSIMMRSTSLEAFPGGWGASRKVFGGVHEAVHIYKVKDKKEYHMVYELNHGGIRSFGMAVALDLRKNWNKVTDKYATGDQLWYTGSQNPWTGMVSHGEVIRSGSNQKLEYDPQNCRWIIQGVLREEYSEPYVSIPWRLGIISRIEPLEYE